MGDDAQRLLGGTPDRQPFGFYDRNPVITEDDIQRNFKILEFSQFISEAIRVMPSAPQFSLHVAASCGNLECVKHLLELKHSIMELDDQNATPLYCACAMGFSEVALHLIANRAAVNARGGEYKYPLLVAARGGHLLDHGANIHALDRCCGDSLYIAAEEGHLETARVLLENGSNINPVNFIENDERYCRPNLIGHGVVATASRGHFKMDKLLLDSGTEIHSQSCGHALLAAVHRGHTELVQLLLERDVDADCHSNLLYPAVLAGKTEIVEALLDRGSDINAQTDLFDQNNALQEDI